MQPEILNRKTVKSVRVKPPTVQLHTDGQVRFGVEAVNLLGLKEGEKIEFIIHQQDKGIIYFTKSESGFELKVSKTLSGKIRLLVLCRPLLKRLFNFFGLTQSKTYDITNETADYYGRKCWFILKENHHVPIKWKR